MENVPVSSQELSSYQDGHPAITLYPEDSKRKSRMFLKPSDHLQAMFKELVVTMVEADINGVYQIC